MGGKFERELELFIERDSISTHYASGGGRQRKRDYDRSQVR